MYGKGSKKKATKKLKIKKYGKQNTVRKSSKRRR